MRRFSLALATATVAAVLLSGAARAQDMDDADAPSAGYSAGSQQDADSRLMIVNRRSGQVVYDDGRNDLYCVRDRQTVGYDYYGRPVRRTSMNCR